VAIAELVEQARADAAFEKSMEDPEYRAYVEKALDEAEADRLAGRFEPIDTVMDRMEGEFKAKHGL